MFGQYTDAGADFQRTPAGADTGGLGDARADAGVDDKVLAKALGQGKIVPCAQVTDVDKSVSVGTADFLSPWSRGSVLAGQRHGRVDGLVDLRVSVEGVIVVGILLVDGQRGINIRVQALAVPSLVFIVQ